mmetsp:Transcript_19451/g.44122  ORF Transcript_19451/g.44122 Transcript_19451/m.44122 type:complete len:211 (+) Transcript_19451:2233-2865(+)
MQACLESVDKAMSKDAKLQFRSTTRTTRARGGQVTGTNYQNKGEYEFGIWASLYADDAATPFASRKALPDASNKTYGHLRKFGLLMHVGSESKKSKAEVMFCPARDEQYEDGDISDLVLNCGGTIGFTESFVYLGSVLHRDLLDHHDADYRIKRHPRPSAPCGTVSLDLRTSPGAALRLRVVVSHGRDDSETQSLAQQAHTRDVPRHHVK